MQPPLKLYEEEVVGQEEFERMNGVAAWSLHHIYGLLAKFVFIRTQNFLQFLYRHNVRRWT